jgi:Bacterial SH3 domain
MVVVIVALVAIKPGVEGWLRWVNEPLSRPDSGLNLGSAVAAPSVAPASRITPQPTPTVIPTRAPTATPAAVGQSRRIVNTDGRGVALRSSPGGDRLPGKGYDEGATVQAFESSGEWTRIRGNDGREGWVLSVTLAP